MSLRAVLLILLVVSCALPACRGQAADADRATAPAASAPPTTVPATVPTRERRPNTSRIIVLGDSLTAGLGLDVAQSFPSLIQQRLDSGGYDYEVVNAGVSGDTSAGGLRRLDWALSDGHPKVLIVALGGNDALRGLAPEQLEQNLTAIIERAQQRGLTVILAGMEAPPNFGAEYTREYRAAFADLAAEKDVAFLPFLLDGVAGDTSLNQADGIHPNVEGTRRVAELVWRALEPLLDRSTTTS